MAIIGSTIPRILAQRSYLGQYKSWTSKRAIEISNFQKSESCGRNPNEYFFRFWLQNPLINNKIGCSVPSQVLYILSCGQSHNDGEQNCVGRTLSFRVSSAIDRRSGWRPSMAATRLAAAMQRGHARIVPPYRLLAIRSRFQAQCHGKQRYGRCDSGPW